VPQPQDPNLDPLLEFFEEHGKPPEPPEPAKDPPADELSVRVDRAERQIERALIDLTTLKSDLATLVGAVEEIKKRPGRPPDRPATVVPLPPPRKAVRARTMATVLLLIAISAAAWGLASAVSYEGRDLPPIESESSNIMAPPTTVEARPPALLEGSGAARSSPDASRPSPRAVNFVGTLTIDAQPAGEVFVNRRRAGPTPLRLDNLRAGSHLIWIERDGYRRWTRVVAVVANRVSRISASLDPLSR
jgi:hypothetical protein